MKWTLIDFVKSYLNKNENNRIKKKKNLLYFFLQGVIKTTKVFIETYKDGPNDARDARKRPVQSFLDHPFVFVFILFPPPTCGT